MNGENGSQGAATRSNTQHLKMARYGYSTASEAPVSPVLFNHRFLNLNMRFNNGIFIIEDPGYYRIGISSYTYDGKTDSKYVGFHLKINSSTKLSQYSQGFKFH